MTAKRPPVGGPSGARPKPAAAAVGDMSEPAEGGNAEPSGSEPESEPDGGAGDDETEPLAGLSDEGVLLLFAGAACLLATGTATVRGQPEPVVVFGAGAATVGLVGVAADLLSSRVPGTGVHLGVGVGAVVAAAAAVPGRHLVNVATFGLAAALVLWRVVDVEYRGAG